MSDIPQAAELNRDPVTGLPTRTGLVAAVSHALENLMERAAAGAMVYVDIDHMRALNNTHGRAGGDAVLKAMASSLVSALGASAIVGRDAGDAFAAFLPDAEAFFGTMAAEEALAAAAAAGQTAGGIAFTVSVGLASYPRDARDAESLLAAARAACRRAFESGSHRAVQSSELGPPRGVELILDRLPCPTFVDRQREFDTFIKYLESCRTSVGYLFVRGEAGVGKSRLIREIARAARAEKIDCASTQCWPADLERPFAPLVRALADMADASLESRAVLMDGLPPEQNIELVNLFALYGVPLPIAPVPSQVDAAARWRLVVGGLASIIARRGHESPFCLFLDEVCYLDAASIGLLGRVAEGGSAGVLVFGVLSDRELRGADAKLRPAAEVWEMRSRSSGVWEMRLGRLSLADTAGMTTSILAGMAVSQEAQRSIYGLCAGNPLYHEFIIHALAAGGQIREAGGAWQVDLSAGTLPRTLDAIIDAACAALPAELLEAAAAVAAAGGPVDAPLVGFVVGCSEAEAVGFIDELLRLRLCSPAAPGSPQVVLSSTRIAERIVTFVGEDFLEMAHAAYAQRAEQLRALGLATGAEVAYHWRMTTDRDVAARSSALVADELRSLWQGIEAGASPGGPVAAAPSVANDLTVSGRAALGDLVASMPKAVAGVREHAQDDPAHLASTEAFLEALARVLDGISLLVVSVRDGTLQVNGQQVNIPAPRGESGPDAATEVAGLLARCGLSSVSIAREAPSDEIALLLIALANHPPDWDAYVREHAMRLVAVEPVDRPLQEAVEGARHSPSTHRIMPFDEGEPAAAPQPRAVPDEAGVRTPPVSRPDRPPTAHEAPRPPADDVNGRPVLDSLGPERILEADGIPPGGDPIRIDDDVTADRVLATLDRLLDENERATAAAICWRVFAGFELASGEQRRLLAALLERIEPRVWRTRLSEAYKAIEDTLAHHLRHEADLEVLRLLGLSAARSLHAFLLAGQYGRIERLGRILAKLGTGAVDENGDIGLGRSGGARIAAFESLAQTDFFDLLMADLASESAERAHGAAAALAHVATPIRSRLIDELRASVDYRLRRAVGETLGALDGGGAVAIAQLSPSAPGSEYERIISVIDVLGLEPKVAEEAVVLAINHPSEGVRKAAVAVAYRLPSSSALGVLQRSVNAGGTLGALRTLQAIGELRLAEALPIVQRQLMDSQDAAVVEAGCRAMGRMADNPEVPSLRVVRLLGGVLGRLSSFADAEEAERAALTALWALGQYDIPEARSGIESAASYPSAKVVAFATSILERQGGNAKDHT